MPGRRIVIGAGPDALRAAAVLATTGAHVTLLQEASSPGGVAHSDIPIGTGHLTDIPERRAIVEKIVTSLVEFQPAARAVMLGGRTTRLPMTKPGAMRLLGEDAGRVSLSYLHTRIGNRIRRITAAGVEERTYRDWVVRRMGEPAYALLYAAYAGHRFGAPPSDLSVSVARVHHGTPGDTHLQVMGGGHDVAIENGRRRIEAAGGEVRTGANVERIDVSDEVVRRVVLDTGEALEVTGPLWVTRSPAQVATWLGAALDPQVRVDAAKLRADTVVQVTLQGDTYFLPEEIHVLDADVPFFRVFRAYGFEKTAVFHGRIVAGSPIPTEAELVSSFVSAAGRIGLPPFSADRARVQVVVDHAPVWTVGIHARLRRVIEAYDRLGIQGVGIAGTMAFIDPAREIAFAAALLEDGASQRELHRTLLDPPVLADDLGVYLRTFVER